jgi:hypothetical protein
MEGRWFEHHNPSFFELVYEKVNYVLNTKKRKTYIFFPCITFQKRQMTGKEYNNRQKKFTVPLYPFIIIKEKAPTVHYFCNI